jgi:hypothetical protein
MHGEWNSNPEKYRRWKGLDADLDPPGRPLPGAYEHQRTVLGEYVVVDPLPPGLRLGLGGFQRAATGLEHRGDHPRPRRRRHPDTASAHTGLPSKESRALHAAGWSHYLERLSLAAAGRDPGPDPLAARCPRRARSQAASLAQEGTD